MNVEPREVAVVGAEVVVDVEVDHPADDRAGVVAADVGRNDRPTAGRQASARGRFVGCKHVSPEIGGFQGVGLSGQTEEGDP